jgi:hypothetical protein
MIKEDTPPKTPTPPTPEKKVPEIEVIDMDWKNSKVYKHVKELMNLPNVGKRQAVVDLEKRFLDPELIDIFSENEASYNAMLLRKRD